MRARHFGLLLLAIVGVVPLVIGGMSVVRRAEHTALDEVRTGNARVAQRVASRLGAFVDGKVELLRSLSGSMTPAVMLSPKQAERILKNYRIAFSHLHSLDVVGRDGHEVATSRLDGVTRSRRGEAPVEQALAGELYLGPIALSSEFAPLMTIAAPLESSGERFGAAIAELDMVGIWAVVNDVRVGASGYARLVTADDTLIAHGDGEERRRVFLREKDPYVDAVRAAGPAGARYRNSQGREVIALAADVPRVGWTVVIEQPVAEAFRGARLMRRDLVLILAGAIVLAVAAGLAFGRGPIRALEAMRRHAREIARGNLDARIAPLPRLEELRSLAVGLNDMAGELKRLQEEMRARERLGTFARVAAGLAHDLKAPIEAIRAICDQYLRNPGDKRRLADLRLLATSHIPRMHRYLEDLRRLVREGEVPIELAAVSPRDLALEVIEDVKATPRFDGITFDVEGEAKRIYADESLLRRALTNLVVNAGDAVLMTGSPGGRVTVKLADGDEGRLLAIAVRDTGKGISDERIQKLMKNDFESDKRSSGVGLGLGVARYVASAHGGSIGIASRVGEGSEFTLVIPRRTSVGVPSADEVGPKEEHGLSRTAPARHV